MQTSKHPISMIAVGMSAADIRLIENAAGHGADIHSQETPGKGLRLSLQGPKPEVMWIHWRTWRQLPETDRQRIIQAEIAAETILVLETTHTADELEQTFANGAVTPITPPLDRAKVREVLRRRREIHDIQGDIMNMAREIYLERELLARKNEQLSFINKFLTRATESLDPITILANARQDLSMLLPAHALQAVFWRPDRDGVLEAELLLAGEPGSAARNAWAELLLSSAPKLTGRSVTGFRITHAPELSEAEATLDHPRSGNNIILPFKIGDEAFGAAALLSSEQANLGRDKVQMLQAALKHLTLALRNGLLFREAKTEADHDGLTKLHNRKHFERRIREEMHRSQRYGQEVSLLMMDLDHFKAVNDIHGHQAGDQVLREVSTVIQDAIRTTDYAARYGGEELAIILPHTDEESARVLAERLRTRIAAKTIRFGGKSIAVTASIGLATATGGPGCTVSGLVEQADQALYMAKSGGRNQVMSSGLSMEAVMQ